MEERKVETEKKVQREGKQINKSIVYLNEGIKELKAT